MPEYLQEALYQGTQLVQCVFLDLDLSFSRLKQEHGEVAMKDKEVGRLTQLNHQLQDEIMSLKNTLADYTLCKKELEGYKKEIQEKVRNYGGLRNS